MTIDKTLARIVRETESALGIDNIQVEALEPGNTISFEDNGSLVDTSGDSDIEMSYYQHGEYTQSTPTNRGLFEKFVPQAI